jgi:hypothetical protein
MIVLVALLVVLVSVPATVVLIALTLAGSAFAAVAEGTVVRPGRADEPALASLQPSPGPASGI